ncbi:MAG: LpxD N-terminal domain-containing protein, partial [Ferruginibacter sp.]
MQFPSPVSITWIANQINAQIIGNKNTEATGINEIHKVEKGDLTFVDHPKYYDKVLKSDATFIMINKMVEAPEGKVLLFVENPFDAYCKIVNHFRPFIPSTKMINDNAKIGEGTFIFPNVYIGNNVSIG